MDSWLKYRGLGRIFAEVLKNVHFLKKTNGLTGDAPRSRNGLRIVTSLCKSFLFEGMFVRRANGYGWDPIVRKPSELTGFTGKSRIEGWDMVAECSFIKTLIRFHFKCSKLGLGQSLLTGRSPIRHSYRLIGILRYS
jgi:hypothetical protein